MKIKWFGHSSFLLTASDGTKVITDPYVPGSYDGAVGYDPIKDVAEGVTVTHDHADHNGYQQLAGSPKLVKGEGDFKVGPIEIKGYLTYHDNQNGALRGKNTVFVYEIDGLRVCHLGDLGHILSAGTVQAIGNIDVLLIPVGGVFTIDAETAHKVAKQLNARVIIPMHFKTEKLGFDIAPVDGFLAGQTGVKKTASPEVEITRENLPHETEIWVLGHAL